MMWVLLEVPAPEDHENGCVRAAEVWIWFALKSFAILNLLICSVGIMGMASTLDPAANQVAGMAFPSTIQVGMGVLQCPVCGRCLAFRKFFLPTGESHCF